MRVIGLTAVLSGALFLTACAPNIGGGDYTASSIGSAEVFYGTVTSANVVQITTKDVNKQGGLSTGALAGAAAGGVLAGSAIGKGRGSLAAGALGALAGGFAGQYAEKAMNDQQGVEYEVKLDDGRLMSVTQGAKPQIGVGQRVRVLKGQDRTRVVPA